MNLLVDSDSFGNLGDLSMVEAVVLQLHSLLPKARIHVLAPRSIGSTIWDVSGIIRQTPYTVRPFGDDALSKLRFFRRHSGLRQRATSMLTMDGLGCLLRAGSLSFRFEVTDHTTRDLARFCEQFDGLHIAGGGNLTDTFLPELFRKCCVIHAFAEQRKPIVLTGQQLGPFRSRSLRRALGRTLRRANFVGLRDPGESMSICSQARLDQGSFACMGDDSLGLPPADDLSIHKLLGCYGLRENEFLALNLRFTTYALKDPNCLQTLASLVDRLTTLLGMPILVVPIHVTGSDNDVLSGQKIADASSATIAVMHGNDLTAPLVKGILGKAFGALGVSHHFCTYALSQGVPAVCIYEGDYYRQKAQALAASWGDNRLAVPLKGLDPTAAATGIAAIVRDENLRARLSLVSEVATQKWRDLFQQKVTAIYGK